MSLGLRVGALGVTGVVVAGLAQAGWLAAWAAGGGAAAWVPVLVQAGTTLVLAAAVGWQIHRSLLPLQRSLGLLRQQADALEQGRFVVAEEPPLLELQPLGRSLNAVVRRMQSALDTAAPAGMDVLRRTARHDAETGLDSRYTFLRKLTERLADRQHPDTAVLVLRMLPAMAHASPSADASGPSLADLVRLLDVYTHKVHGAFAGRLSETDVALCLPAHGEAEACAHSLLGALAAQPRQARAVVATLDHLAGSSLGSALSMLDLSLGRAESQGSGSIESRSARDAVLPDSADAPQRKAIVEAVRRGDLKLAEFPVLDARGELLHLECPMRLRLEAQGLYEPAEAWLGTASRYRLMTQIDLAGLEQALAACAADGRSRCVHVAAESLATAGFVSAVRARLEASPVAATRLWIEIAELSFERLPPRLRNAGTVWRRCGARVGIEHAGAALRSLAHLGDLDIDYVKVDPSFVRGAASDDALRERLRGVVALVHEMGARVIAEGADEAADLVALWQLGFDGATGQAVTRAFEAAAPQAQAMSPA